MGGGIFIREGSYIGKGCDFGCANKIIIEKNCLFGPFVHLSDRDHNYENINVPIIKQGNSSKGEIIIGEGSWLGFRSQVLSNVRIGKNCVIGAGAVVAKNIPDYCVVAGNPGKIVKRYNLNTRKWEKV